MNWSSLKIPSVVLVTIIISYMLTILPLPNIVVNLRPAWTALVIIFWVMLIPHRMSIVSAWCVGLFLDVLNNTLLGEHALALAVIAYLVARSYVRLQLYPVSQQALFVLLFLFLYQVMIFIPQALVGAMPTSWFYWLAPIVGMLLWPWISYLLSSVSEKYRIS